MAAYNVNRGVGRSVEVKGLRAQYVALAVVGVVLSFAVFLLLSFITTQLIAVIALVLSVCISLGAAVYLNSRFGEKGLSRYFAAKAAPGRIACGTRVRKLVKQR